MTSTISRPSAQFSVPSPASGANNISANNISTVWFATADPLVSAGVEAWGSRVGVEGRFVPIVPDQLVTALAAGPTPDLVLWWLDDPCGLDALASVDPLATVLPADIGVVAVTQRRLHSVAKLRLAEAGVGWLADRRWLADAIESLPSSEQPLAALVPPDRFALPDAAVLRERLGFARRGQLLALMQAARQHPSSVWTSNLPQTKLPLTRGDVMSLRSVAGLAAGVPEPSFTKHACSTKNAPNLPEWNDVKRVVRLAMGLAEQP